MSLKGRLAADLKTALKERDIALLGVLRMLKSKIVEREVELRIKKGKGYELSDDEALEVIAAYAKQRRQSIESYRKADRPDLVEKEEAELDAVNRYLPQPLSEEELQRLVTEAIREVGAEEPQQMGQVMKAVMPKVKGRADGNVVSRIVREQLARAE